MQCRRSKFCFPCILMIDFIISMLFSQTSLSSCSDNYPNVIAVPGQAGTYHFNHSRLFCLGIYQTPLTLFLKSADYKMKRFSIIQEILSGPRSSLNLTWIYESFCSRFSFQVVLYNDFIIVIGQKKKKDLTTFTSKLNPTVVNSLTPKTLVWIITCSRD